MGKGRPEKLTPRLRIIVTEILKNNPKRKPMVIEEDLRHILLKDEETIKEFKKEFKSVDTSESKTKITFDKWIKEEKLPGHSAIAKLKTKLNRPKERGPLEAPWNLGSLDTYPIPFEAVPFLLEIADFQKKAGHSLTIRDAKWIGRLSLLKDENKGPQKENEKEEEYEARIGDYQINLVITAANYAAHEKACEKIGLIPVDTSMFDAPTLKETDRNINLYRYGTDDIEMRDGQLFSNGQPLLYAGNELEKKLNRTKKEGK
jgi:hypothetical protein